MAIIKWRPLFEPFEEMDKFMDEWKTPGIQGFTPAIDVYETKNDVVVETPLAGIDPKDVDISVENDVLTIRGEAKKESEVEEKNYYRKEVRSGSFFRSVALPSRVLADDAKAEYEKGVLKISIPKSSEAKAKSIPISISKE